MPLCEPCLVLKMGFIIGCLLCFMELVVHRMLNEFSCMLVFVGVPMMTGVEELAPCWRSHPFGLDVLDGCHEALDGSPCLCGRLL